MKNIDKWLPTKFKINKKALSANLNSPFVSITSSIMVTNVAKFYNDSIPKYASGSLLDLGCGYVPLYDFYKNFVNQITCVDWANSYHENPHLDIVADLNKALPLESELYETIILSDVLEHIMEPLNLISEMERLLKPGGHILMNVPFLYWIHESPYDFHRYTQFGLQGYFDKTTLKVKEIEPYGGILEVLGDILGKTIIYLPVIGKILSKACQSFFYFLSNKTSFGSKLKFKTLSNFPLGYQIVLTK